MRLNEPMSLSSHSIIFQSFYVTKENGELHMVQDFRDVNKAVISLHFPVLKSMRLHTGLYLKDTCCASLYSLTYSICLH